MLHNTSSAGSWGGNPSNINSKGQTPPGDVDKRAALNANRNIGKKSANHMSASLGSKTQITPAIATVSIEVQVSIAKLHDRFGNLSGSFPMVNVGQ